MSLDELERPQMSLDEPDKPRQARRANMSPDKLGRARTSQDEPGRARTSQTSLNYLNLGGPALGSYIIYEFASTPSNSPNPRLWTKVPLVLLKFILIAACNFIVCAIFVQISAQSSLLVLKLN